LTKHERTEGQQPISVKEKNRIVNARDCKKIRAILLNEVGLKTSLADFACFV